MPRLATRLLSAALSISAFGMLAEQANAAELESAFSNHVYAKCAAAPPDPGDETAVVCDSPVGIPVYYRQSGGKASLSLGQSPLSENALSEFPFYQAGPTIEWRGEKKDGRVVPIAAIVRYAVGTSPDQLRSNAFIVYRLQPDGVSCVMAVFGIFEEHAGVRARSVVDKSARDFKCGETRRGP